MANEFKIKKGLIVTGADGGTVVDIQGSQGQLFSVTDDLSGSIFAVSDISGVPILDVNSSGLSTFDGNVNLPDNKKILVGTGNDLEIYHDGSNSYIKDVGTGNLRIRSTSLRLENTDSSNMIVANGAGSVSLYYNAVKKFETTNTGVTVTGTISADDNIYLDGAAPILQVSSSNNASGFRINVTGIADSTNNLLRVQRSGTTMIDTRGNGNTTFTAQVFSAATSSGDASSTLTTKGYVDGLITGATIYRGAWDPSGGGYGSPDLSGVTQTSGYYYICSAAGTAEPNGTGTEPDTWAVGDWVIYNDVSGTGQWQKIDNSSVLSGVGTGQTVALWEGAGSVTDSETLGNAPITVSGNDTTFAGIATGTSFSSSTDSGININGITMTRVAVNSAIRVGNGLETLGLLRSYAGLNVATSTVLGSTTQGNTLIVTSGQGSLNTAFSSAGNGGYTQYQSGNDGIYGYIGSGSHLLSPVVNDNDFVLRAQGEFAVSIGATEKMRINSSGGVSFAGTITAPTFQGDLNGTINTATTGVTQTAGNNSTLIATTEYADAAASAVPIGNYLPLAGGTMTGVTQFNDHTQHGDQVSAKWGAGNDLTIQHNATNSAIANSVGNLYISNHADDKDIIFECDNGSGASVSYLTLDGSTTDAYFSNPGNVGIGTTSPSSKLDVAFADNSSPQRWSYSPSESNYFLELDTNIPTSSVVTYNFNVKNNGTTYNNNLVLDRGNVGIGTTSPDAILETSKEVDGNQVGALLTNTRQAGAADSVSLNFGLGRTADGYIRSVDAIKLLKEQQWTGTPSTVDAALVFSTVQNEAVSERARITSTGHLQVSTGYFELTSQPTTKLWLSTNQVQLYAGNLLVFGGYNASNDAVVIGNESGDVNVTLAGGANDKVLYLEGSSGNVGIGTKTPLAKLDIQGTQGQLFSVTDDLSGSIFAVSDISGVPIFDVNSNGTSVFDGSVGIGGATQTNRELKVHGHTLVDGNIYVSGALNTYSIEVGQSRTTEGVAFLDLTGEVAPDDYGLRMIRYGGLNAESKIIHTGTANLTINAENGGDTVFTNTNVGIGTTSPSTTLQLTKANTEVLANQPAWPTGILEITDTSAYNAGTGATIVFRKKRDSTGNQVTVGAIAGEGVAGDSRLSFWTGTAAYMGTAPKMVIDDTGNVGIGTTTPGSKLEVNGDIDTTGSNGYLINGKGWALEVLDVLTLGDWDGQEFSTRIMDNNSNEVLRVTDGKVGIGTTNPGASLSVASTTSDYVAKFSHSTATGYAPGSILLQAGQGNSRGQGLFHYNTEADENWFTGVPYNVQSKKWIVANKYSTTQDVDTAQLTHALMTIDSDTGNVGIGVTAPAVKLHVNQGNTSGTVIKASGIQAQIEIQTSTAGDAHLYMRPNTTGNNAAIFKMTAGTNYNWRWQDDAATPVVFMQLSQSNSSLSVKGDIIAYGSPSDERYKENIKPIESALDKAVKLQGVTFDWKESDSILDIKEDIGFIAQDVQKVVPELVRENEDGKLSLRYQGVTPILLEAIKELKAEIDLLKSKPCNCNNCNCSI